MTIKRPILYFSLALLAAAFADKSQADPTEVGVTGSIKPTNACTLNLSDTVLTYGDIAAADLSKDKPTALAAKPLTLSVACAPQAAKFYFQITDKTPSEWWVLDEDLGAAAGATGGELLVGMGLGMTSSQQRVGGVFLKLTDVQADQDQKALRVAYDSDYSWTAMYSAFLRVNRFYTVAEQSANTPTSAKVFAIKLDVIPVISPKAIDGLSAEAKLNGNFTIEVTQL